MRRISDKNVTQRCITSLNLITYINTLYAFVNKYVFYLFLKTAWEGAVFMDICQMTPPNVLQMFWKMWQNRHITNIWWIVVFHTITHCIICVLYFNTDYFVEYHKIENMPFSSYNMTFSSGIDWDLVSTWKHVYLFLVVLPMIMRVYLWSYVIQPNDTGMIMNIMCLNCTPRMKVQVIECSCLIWSSDLLSEGGEGGGQSTEKTTF